MVPPRMMMARLLEAARGARGKRLLLHRPSSWLPTTRVLRGVDDPYRNNHQRLLLWCYSRRRHYFSSTSTATIDCPSTNTQKRQQHQQFHHSVLPVSQSTVSSSSLFLKSYSFPLFSHHQTRHISDKTNRSDETASTSPVDNEEEEEELLVPFCLAPYAGLPSHPDVIDLEPGQRLIALGDVHGDFEHLLEALKLAQVVVEEYDDEDDEEGAGGGRSFQWVGGNTIVTQIGDVLDRGPHELQCWQLLADLSRQAHVVGGRVIFLYGNHELWTSIGFYQLDHDRYMQNIDYDDGIDDDFEIAFGAHLDETLQETDEDWRNARVLHEKITQGTELHPYKVAARWAAMEPGGLLAQHFLVHFKMAIQVGHTLLVHAGMVPEHLERYGGIAGMNKATQRWILKQGPKVGRHAMFVPPNDSEGRLRTYVQSMPEFFMEGDDNAYSPIWMRDYSDPPDEVAKNHLVREMIGMYNMHSLYMCIGAHSLLADGCEAHSDRLNLHCTAPSLSLAQTRY
jgi:hypothetical protein